MKKILLVCLLLLTACVSKTPREKYKNVVWNFNQEQDNVFVALVEKEQVKKSWDIPLPYLNMIYEHRYDYSISNYFYVYGTEKYVLVVYQ